MSVEALIRQAHDAGVLLRLVDGKVKAIGTRAAVALMLEPLRQHRADLVRWFTQVPANGPEPNTDPKLWRELHNVYIAHHWSCRTCIAGSQGRGMRCGTGSALWRDYMR